MTSGQSLRTLCKGTNLKAIHNGIGNLLKLLAIANTLQRY